MDQSILFFALVACIGVQALFLFNHRYLFKGCLFSAFSGIGCLVILQYFFPAMGIFLTAPTLAVSAAFGIPGCIFLLLIKLICGV